MTQKLKMHLQMLEVILSNIWGALYMDTTVS